MRDFKVEEAAYISKVIQLKGKQLFVKALVHFVVMLVIERDLSTICEQFLLANGDSLVCLALQIAQFHLLGLALKGLLQVVELIFHNLYLFCIGCILHLEIVVFFDQVLDLRLHATFIDGNDLVDQRSSLSRDLSLPLATFELVSLGAFSKRFLQFLRFCICGRSQWSRASAHMTVNRLTKLQLVTDLVLELFDLFILHLNQVEKHLIVFSFILTFFILNLFQLAFLQLNDFCVMSVLHFELSISQVLIFVSICLILLLQEDVPGFQLLESILSLGLNILTVFQGLNFILQQLVLLLQLVKLITLIDSRTNLNTCSLQLEQFIGKLLVFLHCLLVSLIQLLVFCHQALLLLHDLIKVLKLLGHEDRLISDHRVDQIQVLKQVKLTVKKFLIKIRNL